MKTNRPTFRSDEYADDSPDISAQKPFKGSDPYRHVAVAYSPGEEVIPIGVRVGKNQLEKYSEELTERDREILASLKKCKFLLTGQIQRLHIIEVLNMDTKPIKDDLACFTQEFMQLCM